MQASRTTTAKILSEILRSDCFRADIEGLKSECHKHGIKKVLKNKKSKRRAAAFERNVTAR